jgi:hypothetical protein
MSLGTLRNSKSRSLATLGADRNRARRARSQDAGSEGCTRRGQGQSAADGANSALDVPAVVEPGRLVAGDQRDPLVDVPLLRFWGSLGDQSADYRRAGAPRDFGGKRDVPNSRPDPAYSGLSRPGCSRMAICSFAEAFRNLKGDLASRRIFHEIEACLEATSSSPSSPTGLYLTLGRRLHALVPGLSPRSAIEKFAVMQMIDLRIPTTDGREIVLSRYTECARHCAVRSSTASSLDD